MYIQPAKVNVTESLTEWLCSVQYDQLPAQVCSKALDVIFDSVSGMVACSILPEVKIICEFLKEMDGKPECTIIGHKGRFSVIDAAMANGGMAHGDEVDPVHSTTSGGHVAAGPIPTALTIGQWINATGKDVIRAVALGYEVGGRLMTIFYREKDYLMRRFYHTSVVATLSSAVSAALLLGLDKRSMQVALGLAGYQAAGPDNMIKDSAHMGKTFQVAAANRNGVTAALLAQKGCFVPLDILDGPLGFFDAFLGLPEVGEEILKDLGKYYAIIDVMHKRYPSGSPNQTYLQGLLRILHQHQIAPQDIDQIEIQIPKRSVHRISSARHASIAGDTVCAMAAVHGKLDFYHLHDQTIIMEPLVQELRKRICFVGREDWKGMEQGRHAIITLTTTQGQKFEEEVWYQPMTRLELEEKFISLVTRRFTIEKTLHMKKLLSELENVKNIRSIMEELEG